VQSFDSLPIDLGEIGMDQRRRRIGCGKFLLQAQLSASRLTSSCLNARTGASPSVIASTIRRMRRSMRSRSMRLASGCSFFVHAVTVYLATEFLSERFEQVWRHQSAAQSVEDHRLQSINADIETVTAGAAIARGRTTK
jgi:hypothetical protein